MQIKQFINQAGKLGIFTKSLSNNDIYLYATRNDRALDNWFIKLNVKDNTIPTVARWNRISNDSHNQQESLLTDTVMLNLMTLINYLRLTPVEKRGIKENKYYLKATRYYTGPVPETYYVEDFESCARYTKIIYGSDPKQFTEMELDSVKRNDPALKEFIDGHKELVHEKKAN